MSVTLKRDVLLRHKGSARYFVETGTYKGTSIGLALSCGFERVYTIDISTKYKREIEAQYSADIKSGKVRILTGDTLDLLPAVLKDAGDIPSVIWLDAHYDEISDTCGRVAAPIIGELDILSKAACRAHTLMVDDIRMFGKQGNWGANTTLHTVLCRIMSVNAGYVLALEDGWEPYDILVAKIG